MSTPPRHWIATTDGEPPAPTGWTRNLAALAEVMFATDAGAPPQARISWTVDQVRRFCKEVGGKAVFVFHLALFAISWLSPLFMMNLPPLRRHSLERREAIVHRFEKSVFGLSIFAVKAFLCMQYFEHPDVADEVGFDGDVR